MSGIISISSNDLGTRKKVQIDGVDFTVRKLGAGEELDLSQIARQTFKLLDKLTDSKDWSDEDAALFDDLKKRSLAIYAKTFDDGGDGSKSTELVERLSDEERNAIYRQVFPKVEIEQTDAETEKPS